MARIKKPKPPKRFKPIKPLTPEQYRLKIIRDKIEAGKEELRKEKQRQRIARLNKKK